MCIISLSLTNTLIVFKMPMDSEAHSKLDKILEKIGTLEINIKSVEAKLDERLIKVEKFCDSITSKQLKIEKNQDKLTNDYHELKTQIHTMQQDELKNNIIIKGVNEIEKDPEDLNFMVDKLLQQFNSFKSEQLTQVRRIGPKKGISPRPVLAQINTSNAKLDIMQQLKDKQLNCEQFQYKNKPWGTKDDKIFLSDHLTINSNNIFYHARQHKRAGRVKYSWTKLGKIYVKKDEKSRAYNINSLEQLHSVVKAKSVAGDVFLMSETETEAETATETDVETGKRVKAVSKRRMNLSNTEDPNGAPNKRTRSATTSTNKQK